MKEQSHTLVLCELNNPGIPYLSSYSPFCEKVHRLLRYAGLSYEKAQGDYPAVHKKWNPLGRVPILLVDGQPIPDSTRIAAWVEEHYPKVYHAGWSARMRAGSWLWEEIADTTLNGFLVGSRWADEENWPRLAEAFFGNMPGVLRMTLPHLFRKRVLKSLDNREIWHGNTQHMRERFLWNVNHLEDSAPPENYWMDETIAIADIAISSQLQGFRTDLTPWYRMQIESRPKLCAYLDRMNVATYESNAYDGTSIAQAA